MRKLKEKMRKRMARHDSFHNIFDDMWKEFDGVWKSFDDTFASMNESFDRLFNNKISDTKEMGAPSSSSELRENEFVVTINAPGFRKDDFDLTTKNGVLRIEGEAIERDKDPAERIARI